MYEDNRKIDSQGFLSQGTKTYTPKPISMRFNAANKPAPDHVNHDKEAMRQRRIQNNQLAMQQQQMEDAQDAGGGKVICTRYYEFGYLDEHVYAADSILGDRLMIENPAFVAWYWSWGIPFVNTVLHGQTKLSRLAIWLGSPLCKAWAQEMAFQVGAVHKGSRVGKWMMKTGQFIFKLSKYNRMEKAVC